VRRNSLEPRLIDVLPADESRGDVSGQTSFGLAEDNCSPPTGPTPARHLRTSKYTQDTTFGLDALDAAVTRELAAALTDAADETERLS
jgi:hypothetical protein